MDSECNIRLSQSQEVQKWEKRQTSFKNFLQRFSKTQTKEASKHLFQKHFASQQLPPQDYSQSHQTTEQSFDQNASIFTIDLGFDAEVSPNQELPEAHHLKKRLQIKKASTISRGLRDVMDLLVQNSSIYTNYRVIQMIHRFKSRQLFIIQAKEGTQKMMMRVSFKMEFRDKHAIRGESEIANFTLMDHPAFPKLKQIYEECNKYYLIFQHREGVTLSQFMLLYEVSEEVARIILKQLLQILQYLHSLEIVHRDIRPDNIFVTNYHQDIHQLQIRIIDMSLAISKEALKRDRETLKGLSFYASPESKTGFINHKYDIWSLGILSIVLLSGFEQMSEDPELFLQSITNRSHLFLQHARKIPKKAAEFINHLLTSKHTYRPNATQALKHSWINKTSKVAVHSFRSHRKVDLEPFIPTNIQ